MRLGQTGVGLQEERRHNGCGQVLLSKVGCVRVCVCGSVRVGGRECGVNNRMGSRVRLGWSRNTGTGTDTGTGTGTSTSADASASASTQTIVLVSIDCSRASTALTAWTANGLSCE